MYVFGFVSDFDNCIVFYIIKNILYNAYSIFRISSHRCLNTFNKPMKLAMS